MFENLQDRLESAFKILKGQGAITEINIASSLKEIRRALVDADVNYKIAKEFTDKVKEEALGQKVITAVQPGQLMVKIVSDELTKLMGGTAVELNTDGDPAVILIAGLQGSGKTTFSAKLANMLKEKNKKRVMLVAGDVYRPAAIEQLKVLGKQIGIDVYFEDANLNPVIIAQNGIKAAKNNKCNVVIIDTAGRLAVDEEMMSEIAAVKATTNPTETLFVVDSMTGQDAVNTAKAFNDQLGFDGVVLTKLDGDTRGGAALTIKYVVEKPIKFISYGEKMETIDVFYPDRMSQRILGMGDIISFVERAQAQFDDAQAEKLQQKLQRNELDFNDFLSQLNQLRKMGNIKDLMSMIPGMDKALKGVEIDDKAFKKIESIIFSMTLKERSTPDLLITSKGRRERIAKGSGNTVEMINNFIKQFEDMRRMMKTIAKMPGAGSGKIKLPFIR